MRSAFASARVARRATFHSLLASATLALLAPLASAQTAAPTFEFAAWEARMAAFYEVNPELKDTKGSGWKPYNRIKHFNEERMVNGADIPAGARWNAFLEKRELERRSGKAATASWFCLGPENLAGRILDLEFDPTDPNILYAGSASGGIWKSTNGGAAWTPLDDELPTLAVNAIAVLPSNPNIVLIGTGEATNNIDKVGGVGILKSTDGGQTWNPTSLTYAVNSGHGFHFMEVSPFNEAILAGAFDGLFRSTDQGDTWTKIRNGTWTDAKWKPGAADTVYMMRTRDAAPGGIKLSPDGGVTSSGLVNGLPSGLVIGKSKLAVSAANSEVVYAGFADYASSELVGIYRSTDAGQNWTLQASTPNIYGQQGWYNNSLIADPNNADRVIAGGVQLYRSTTGGTNFTNIGGPVHVDHHAAVYRPGSDNNLFVGSDGGVWESTDDGTSWIDRNAGLVTYQFYDICVSPPDPLRSWGGTQDQGTDRWVNSQSWLEGLGADGMVCNGHPTNPNIVYGEIQFGVHYKSTNGGASWFSINNGIGGTSPWVTPVAIDPNNGDHLFSQDSNGILRTLDGGNNWVNVDGLGAASISVSPLSSSMIWVVGGTLARYSTDMGDSWTAATTIPFTVPGSTRIEAHPTDINTAVVTFGGYGVATRVARTTDLGVTWEDRTANLPLIPINALAIDPQNPRHWFVGTDVGAWATTTEGEVWAPFETDLPNVVVVDLEIQNSSRKLRAGTHGRGMWEIDLATAPATGVGPTVVSGPINLMLDPPSPNPFRGETMLRYAAREEGQTLSLAVYDVQGRLVEVLARHAADGIIRQQRWSPSRAADGVYFAMLRVGEMQKSQKLVVVE